MSLLLIVQHQEKPEIDKPELMPDQLKNLFEKPDLSVIEAWSKSNRMKFNPYIPNMGSS